MLKNCRLQLLVPSLAALFLIATGLAACASHTPRPAAALQTPVVASISSLPAAGTYRVDPTHSEIRLLVYRAGPLARLGHNHVIINHEMSGSARIASTAAPGEAPAAAFSLTVPVAGFIVDDALARSEEGADFSEEVSDDARSGTLHNLLSSELLDAVRFPTITLDSVSVAVAGGGWTSTLALNVAGHRSTAVVPFTTANADGSLIATGRVTLRQSTLGLTPFSALLGALAVQDVFDVKFKVVAVPQ